MEQHLAMGVAIVSMLVGVSNLGVIIFYAGKTYGIFQSIQNTIKELNKSVKIHNEKIPELMAKVEILEKSRDDVWEAIKELTKSFQDCKERSLRHGKAD